VCILTEKTKLDTENGARAHCTHIYGYGVRPKTNQLDADLNGVRYEGKKRGRRLCERARERDEDAIGDCIAASNDTRNSRPRPAKRSDWPIARFHPTPSEGLSRQPRPNGSEAVTHKNITIITIIIYLCTSSNSMFTCRRPVSYTYLREKGRFLSDLIIPCQFLTF